MCDSKMKQYVLLITRLQINNKPTIPKKTVLCLNNLFSCWYIRYGAYIFIHIYTFSLPPPQKGLYTKH